MLIYKAIKFTRRSLLCGVLPSTIGIVIQSTPVGAWVHGIVEVSKWKRADGSGGWKRADGSGYWLRANV